MSAAAIRVHEVHVLTRLDSASGHVSARQDLQASHVVKVRQESVKETVKGSEIITRENKHPVLKITNLQGF